MAHSIKLLSGFSWRDVADRLEDAAVVEPVHPFESSVFHGIKRSPWPAPVDHRFPLWIISFSELLGK